MDSTTNQEKPVEYTELSDQEQEWLAEEFLIKEGVAELESMADAALECGDIDESDRLRYTSLNFRR